MADIKKSRGRPRVFDTEEALEKVLQIFWERGYEGASLAELTETLGINKPSLYAAFGNKEALFKKALTLYLKDSVSFVSKAIEEPTAYKVAKHFLVSAAEFLTDTQHPKGCMIVQGALSCGDDAEIVKHMLIQHRNTYEALLKTRFEKAKSDGDLSNNVNTAALAKYLATIHQGMSIQATSGASKDELLTIVKMALSTLASLNQP